MDTELGVHPTLDPTGIDDLTTAIKGANRQQSNASRPCRKTIQITPTTPKNRVLKPA
ncbi:MAG: hypothetical protein L0H29_00850 [Sinobacteraceae bacterium]|nr:hypothetical protein [Nevskiaceae bacterium]